MNRIQMSFNAQETSERGIEIYNKLFKAELEKDHTGRFLAINVIDESATLGDTSSEVLLRAKKEKPNGFFHLIKIGYPAAFGLDRAHSQSVPTTRLHR